MRNYVADLGSQPIRNLVPRPIAASGGGWTRIFTSIAADLGFVSGVGPFGNTTFRNTWTAAGNANVTLGFGITSASPNQYVTLTPGLVHNYSIYVRSSTPQSVRLRLRFMDAAGTAVGADFYPVNAYTYIDSTSFTRISAAYATPEGAVLASVHANVNGSGNVVVGDWFEVTMAQVTEGPALRSYFDGSMPTAAWQGSVANAATSAGYALSYDAISNVAPIVDLRNITSFTNTNVGNIGDKFTIAAVWINTINNGVPVGQEGFAKIEDSISNGGVRFLVGNSVTWTGNSLRGASQAPIKMAIMSVRPQTMLMSTHENSIVASAGAGSYVPFQGNFGVWGRTGGTQTLSGMVLRAMLIPTDLNAAQVAQLRTLLANEHGVTVAA